MSTNLMAPLPTPLAIDTAVLRNKFSLHLTLSAVP